jgi:3'-5' exoribonuclease
MNFTEQTKKMTIEDLKVGDKFNWYYKIISLEKRSKKDGDAFLTLELMDKTGRVSAKIWENADYFQSLITVGEIYKIEGVVNEFRNQKDIRIFQLQKPQASDTEYNAADYTEQSSFDTEKTYNDVMRLLNDHIQNPFLKDVVTLFSKTFKDQFKNHYGAMKIHHAYIGGLLEHTCAIMKLAVTVADHYQLDKELLLIGALFHDIGKIEEFTSNPAAKMTIAGGLLGHIVLGNAIFTRLAQQIEQFPLDLQLKIQHLIISHHGEKEFGSPELPKIPEAMVLYALDLLDSKLKIFSDVIKMSSEKDDFSEYVPVISRRLLIEKKESAPKATN